MIIQELKLSDKERYKRIKSASQAQGVYHSCDGRKMTIQMKFKDDLDFVIWKRTMKLYDFTEIERN